MEVQGRPCLVCIQRLSDGAAEGTGKTCSACCIREEQGRMCTKAH